MTNRENSIEAAKNLVSTQFNSVNASYGMLKGDNGYAYETKAPNDVAKQLVELQGTYVGAGKEPGTILLENNSTRYMLMMVKDTTYSKYVAEKKSIALGEKLYTIAVKVEDYPLYIPVVVLRKAEKEPFLMVKSLYGRANAIKDFYKLGEGKQAIIRKQLNGEHYKRFASENDMRFTKQELKLKYALTKETYPLDTQRVIEALFKDPNPSKSKADQRLNYILRISTAPESTIPVTPKAFAQTLDKQFYKMNRPKQLLKDIFSAKERAVKKGCKVLLVGPPGVGKTSLMKAVADALHRPFEYISLNCLSNPLELEGLDPAYDSADAGAFVRAYAAHGTTNIVIGLDEFDKINRYSKEGDSMNVFLRSFLGEHYDKFLQCTIKTADTVFIATANSLENIPETVKNRFDAIISLDEYTCEDKVKIAKQFIISEVLKNYNISLSNIRFASSALEHIIKNYCEDDGARDLKHNIEKIVCRIVGMGKANSRSVVSVEFAEEVLHELVDETPGLYFCRNRAAYTEPVAREIRKCLEACKKTVYEDSDQFNTGKKREKLEYLLTCKKENSTFKEEFHPKMISETLHRNLFGMDKVIREVTNFYYTEYIQGSRLNGNLALCGGFGIGKTAIAKGIAEAMGYKYVKISLNGVDDMKVLRGFPGTYIGSEPGRIMKGIKVAGTTRVILQLDELDKLKAEYAAAIIDLLDHEFTDNFLDAPVDFSQTIFIATANDWGNVPAVLRDRFIVIKVDGYTHGEKSQILSDYIIPKIEKGYAASGVTISMDADAREYLLKTYANSFGVRDVEKAMQRICAGKLVDQAGVGNSMQVLISRADVSKYLGAEPIPRGNFPENQSLPGVSKALAVNNGNTGSAFAIETVLLDGAEMLEVTGLPRESAADSVKIAVTCVKKMYPALLNDKQIHVHFGEGSVPKDGPSAGIALFMSLFSAAVDKPLMDKKPYDIAYTGELSLTGGVFAVGGIFEKIQATCDSGCCKVFIPMQNYERLDKEKLKEFACEVIPVSHISQVVKRIYPEFG